VSFLLEPRREIRFGHEDLEVQMRFALILSYVAQLIFPIDLFYTSELDVACLGEQPRGQRIRRAVLRGLACLRLRHERLRAHEVEQVHVERIKRNRATFARVRRMFEKHEARIAVQIIGTIGLLLPIRYCLLRDPIGDDFAIRNRTHWLFLTKSAIRNHMHASVPAAIGRDREYAAMRQLELIDLIHHRIGLPLLGGRCKTFCRKERRADNHGLT
jgi:hypothetical protein